MRSADLQAGPRQGKRLFREFFRGLFVLGSCLALVALATPCFAQGGATFPTLEVKGVVYHDVKVLSMSATTVTIRHRDGLAQVELRSLSPELQQRFGYDPLDGELDALLQANERQMKESKPRPAPKSRPVVVNQDTPVGRALGRFGTVAKMEPVDLRPQFRALELGMKNQGLRPSCAVFAVVSALEFQNAAAVGHPEKLSEEYLIWATRRTLGIGAGEKRTVEVAKDEETGEPDTRDAGFNLQEVLAAVRAYGVPLQEEMPNTFGLAMEKIPDPADTVVASARSRRQVSTYIVPGVNNQVKIANIIHALNEGVPVVIGLRWPHGRTLMRSALLSQQTPLENRSHAVTLVGYFSEDGSADGIRFIFKNSWGIRWGTGGYGFAEAGYLRKNLLEAVVLEVRASGG